MCEIILMCLRDRPELQRFSMIFYFPGAHRIDAPAMEITQSAWMLTGMTLTDTPLLVFFFSASSYRHTRLSALFASSYRK